MVSLLWQIINLRVYGVFAGEKKLVRYDKRTDNEVDCIAAWL